MSQTAATTTPLITRSFASLLVAQASFGYAFSSYFLLPKFLDTALAARPSEIGLVTAVHGLAVIAFLPLMGAAVDRFGRRDFLTAGALVMAVASFAFTAVDEVGPLLYALRAIQGIAFSMAFAAGAALAVDEAPPERMGQAIGIFGLTFLSMNALAPATVEEVVGRSGWPPAFALAGVAALLCAALSRRLRDVHVPHGDGQRNAGLWEVARRAGQIRVSIVIALVGVALGSVFIFHQPFARELGMTHVRGFFIGYTTAAVAVRVGLGQFVDRVGHRRVSLATLVLYVFAVTGMAGLRPGGLPLYGAALGIAHGLFYPAFNAVAVSGVGERERGKVMALFQAAFHVGFSGGALGLGLLAERSGYPAVFQASGACVLAALLLLLASPDGRARRTA